MTLNSLSNLSVRRALILLTIIYLPLTAWNLHLQHIVSPDEPRYACAARTMIETNDFVIPFFNSEARLEKPVFFHLALTVAARIANVLNVSVDTIGFRVAPLFAGWMAVVALFLLGRSLLNTRGAFIACIVLITCYHFHNTARELVVDMTLSACLLWSWLFFHIAVTKLDERKPALLPLLGFYLSLGCACMTKGPFLVGVFSTVPLLTYLIWTKRAGLLLRAGIWWGMPLSMLIGLTWFVAVSKRGYDPTPFFSVENLARYFGQKDHIHYIPFFYYLLSLPLIFAPYAFVIPFAAWWTFKQYKQNYSEITDGAKLTACALGVGFLIVGGSVSKRHLYLIPLFPWLAFWIGWYVERALLVSADRKAPRFVEPLFVLLGALAFCTAAWAVYWLPTRGAISLETAFAAVFGTVIAVAFFLTAREIGLRNYLSSTVCALVAAAALTLCVEGVVRPIHERELNLTAFYDGVRAKLGDRKLVILGLNANEASWYLDRTPGPIDETNLTKMKTMFFESPGTVMLAPVATLKKYPLLEKSVIPISDPFLRNRLQFELVLPSTLYAPEQLFAKVHASPPKLGFFDKL